MVIEYGERNYSSPWFDGTSAYFFLGGSSFFFSCWVFFAVTIAVVKLITATTRLNNEASSINHSSISISPFPSRGIIIISFFQRLRNKRSIHLKICRTCNLYCNTYSKRG